MGRLGIYEYPEIGIDEAMDIIKKFTFKSPSFSYEKELQNRLAIKSEESKDIAHKIELDKLARSIGHKSSASGTFRDKIAALRRYGLLHEHTDSRTDLTSRILGAATEEEFQLAQIEARDNVDLFAKLVYAKIDITNESKAASLIRTVCKVSNKNNDKKINKILSILTGFYNRIGKENWYGQFVEEDKLEKNLKRLRNAKLASAASGAIWAQFNQKRASPLDMLEVFNAFQRTKDERVRLNLLKAIRDGMNRLTLVKDDMNKICDYLVDIIITNYNKPKKDPGVRIAEVAVEALAYLNTDRRYDKLLKCMIDYCKNNRIFDDYIMGEWEDDDLVEEEAGGRPEPLLTYLAHVNRDKLVETIWDEMGKENDRYKSRQLEELLERIGEIKIWE